MVAYLMFWSDLRQYICPIQDHQPYIVTQKIKLWIFDDIYLYAFSKKYIFAAARPVRRKQTFFFGLMQSFNVGGWRWINELHWMKNKNEKWESERTFNIKV